MKPLSMLSSQDNKQTNEQSFQGREDAKKLDEVLMVFKVPMFQIIGLWLELFHILFPWISPTII